MSSLNKVLLIGRLGKEPEIRSMSNSKKVISFPLATSTSWNDKNTGEKVERTEWHNIVIFSEALIRVLESFFIERNILTKGTRVYIEGTLKTRKWVDNNNNNRYTTEVVLNNYGSELKILESAQQSGQSPPQDYGDQVSDENNTAQSSVEDDICQKIHDDIPF